MARHPGNEATIIEYKAADGTKKLIAVKDAKFRNVMTFGVYSLDVSILTNFKSLNKSGKWSIGGDGVSISQTSVMPDNITNDLIFEQWATSLVTDKTAKANCDIWMTYLNTYGVPAVAWCRSQNIGGTPCDLANQYQNICIWTCGDKLDEMDPTASAYSDLKLGYTAKADGFGRTQKSHAGHVSSALFSSTEHSDSGIRSVFSIGGCSFTNKKNNCTVVPILEIS